jgi:hypothetical protein
MIEGANSLNALVQSGNIACVAAVGVRTRRVRRFDKTTVRDVFSLFRSPVGTCFDVVNLTDGYMIEVYHVTPDVWLAGLFTEQIATTRHTMFQGDALYCQGTVFVDYFLNRSVNRMKVYFIVEIVAEQSHLPVQDVFHFLWSIDSQTGCSPQQPKGAEHSYQPEAMVAMQVGNENGTDLGKADTGAPQLNLRAFSAIYQEQFSPHLHHLRGCIVTNCGQSAATA